MVEYIFKSGKSLDLYDDRRNTNLTESYFLLYYKNIFPLVPPQKNLAVIADLSRETIKKVQAQQSLRGLEQAV